MYERDIVSSIKKSLQSIGPDVFFWKEHCGPYGTSGIPDIICCYRGVFLGLECKRPSGQLTELQKRTISKIKEAGGIAARVESVADVRLVLQQADERIKTHNLERRQ